MTPFRKYEQIEAPCCPALGGFDRKEVWHFRVRWLTPQSRQSETENGFTLRFKHTAQAVFDSLFRWRRTDPCPRN